MIYLENNPSVDFNLIDSNRRCEGLSGFIRAKNEGEYIYQVIKSWLSLVDELIIVFNDCSDNTELEIKRAIIDFGSKIKAFKYLPKVYPQGSKEHIALPPNNSHSLVNYYNYALSKTTHKFVVKIDGDIILDSSAIGKVKKFISCSNGNDYLKLHGVNLIDNNNKLYVPSNSMFCGMNGDLCVFPISSTTYFKWRKEFEYLDISSLKDAGGVYAYYHMKFVKKDMGFGNYLLSDNPDSRYVEITKNFIIGLKFIDVDYILNDYKINLKMPSDLSIKATVKREFKKEYINELCRCNIFISSKDIVKFRISNIKVIIFSLLKIMKRWINIFHKIVIKKH